MPTSRNDFPILIHAPTLSSRPSDSGVLCLRLGSQYFQLSGIGQNLPADVPGMSLTPHCSHVGTRMYFKVTAESLLVGWSHLLSGTGPLEDRADIDPRIHHVQCTYSLFG